jgi:hypothetical protein
MAVKINDNRKSWDEFKTKLEELKKRPHVAVGVLGKEGAELYEGDEVTTVDVATFNEFGTTSEDGTVAVPARSFIRSTYDRDQSRFLAILRRYKMQLVTNKLTTNQVLTFIGQFAQKQIQGTITAGGIPYRPNSDATIDRKGSSAPLIDTGQMRQSIRYEVRNGD